MNIVGMMEINDNITIRNINMTEFIGGNLLIIELERM